mgnify:CR=1 FL=1
MAKFLFMRIKMLYIFGIDWATFIHNSKWRWGPVDNFPRIAYQSNGLSRDDAVAHLFQQ